MLQPDAAIADCNEALRLDPKLADAYLCRGMSYFAKIMANTEELLKHPERWIDPAIADVKEALRLDPNNPNYSSTFQQYVRVKEGLAK